MLPRHVLAMLRDDGFDPSHQDACGAGTEAEYAALKIRVMSAPKAAAYKPKANKVAISIRGLSERATSLSSRFLDVLELVFDDIGEFANYVRNGLDNPNSITPAQADAVATFAYTYRDAKVLMVHCTAGVSRSRSLAAAVCNALRLPYRFTVVNDDVYGAVLQAFARISAPVPSTIQNPLATNFDRQPTRIQALDVSTVTARGRKPSSEEMDHAIQDAAQEVACKPHKPATEC